MRQNREWRILFLWANLTDCALYTPPPPPQRSFLQIRAYYPNLYWGIVLRRRKTRQRRGIERGHVHGVRRVLANFQVLSAKRPHQILGPQRPAFRSGPVPLRRSLLRHPCHGVCLRQDHNGRGRRGGRRRRGDPPRLPAICSATPPVPSWHSPRSSTRSAWTRPARRRQRSPHSTAA